MPIFYQGYQHWQGPLSGHAWRWLAIARHGVRVQMKSWMLKLLLLAAWLPAVGLVAAVVLWGLLEQKSEGALQLVGTLLPPDMLQTPRAYRATMWTLAYSYFFKYEMFFIMMLVVVAGPGLISRDLRFNALPLYFARPMTRLDYFLGKLGVIAALVGMAAVGPAVFAYVIGVCFSRDVTVVKDTYTVLLASTAYGLLIALSIGAFMLALSSLTRRSLYVGIAWAGMWIISGSVGSILTAVHEESVRRGAQEEFMGQWLAENPPPPGARMVAGYHPVTEWNQKDRKFRMVGVDPDREDEAELWYQKWAEALPRARADSKKAAGRALREDWRPLCSYVANLERIGEMLLGTDAAWVAIGEAFDRSRRLASLLGMSSPLPENKRRFADERVLQYPWEWSAGVLATLLGLSIWTLSRRVKSLDRLK